MRHRLAKTIGMGMRLVLALALLSLALYAPAEAGSRTLTSAEIAAYTLPDGSLPALCVTVPDGSGKGQIIKLGGGALGLHNHPVALPLPDDTAGARPLGIGLRIAAPAAITLSAILYPPGSGPRAPPQA